jgi:putative (di)nucleoside polyphosphate hydrolase
MNHDKKVFSGQRLDNSNQAWQMPQGGIDEGETPIYAAYRELYEETGIKKEKVEQIATSKAWINYDLPQELIPRLWGGKYRGQKQKWFLFKFNGLDDDIDINTEHKEFSNWCWMSPSSLMNSIVPFKKEVYKKVFSEFGNEIRVEDTN